MKRLSWTIFGLIGVVFLSSCSNFADMNTAKYAYSHGDYKTANSHYSRLARFGHTGAKVELGKAYLYGRGVERDPAKALALFKEAAAQGDTKYAPRYIPRAKTYLGALALKQPVEGVSSAQALNLLEESAQSGSSRALFELGYAYEKGNGVPKNYAKAASYYRQSADLGYSRAYFYEAELYASGKARAPDGRDTLTLYEVAGQRGYARGYEELAKIYKDGRGVDQNIAKADRYNDLASALDVDDEDEIEGAVSPWDRLEVDASATLQYINESNRDLGAGNEDNRDSLSEQLQIYANYKLTDKATLYSHIRALNINGDSGFDDDTGTVNSTDSDQAFLELRELFWRYQGISDVYPLTLQVGRQRLREPRALWWNSDNDLVKIAYEGTVASGFLAAGENLASYRTGPDKDDYRGEDEDRFRVIGESSYQYKAGHFLEGRFVFENDHSGTRANGTTIPLDDRDDFDHENVLWGGVRAAGLVGTSLPMLDKMKYRADLMGVVGEETLEASTGGPGATQRTVGALSENDIRAWAFDGGVTFMPSHMGGIAISAGYAYGSGDDDAGDGTDHEFRQTGLEGSSSRIGLGRQQQKNYGEVLRPELSNIHVARLGAAYPLNDASDASLTYFYYYLGEDATSLRSSGISAPLNGTDKDVGQGLDFIVNVNVAEQFDLHPRYVDGIDFRFILGSFFPGDAYEPNGDDNAYRAFSEIKLKF